MFIIACCFFTVTCNTLLCSYSRAAQCNNYLCNNEVVCNGLTYFVSQQTGRWKYKAINTGIRQRISLLVLSSPGNASDVPVQLTGSLINKPNVWPTTMHIIGEATQRGRPVLGLTMYATVFGPFGDPISTQLMDNGAGTRQV